MNITAPTPPDNLLAVAVSYDDTGKLGAQTPFSDQVANHWEGGKWEVLRALRKTQFYSKGAARLRCDAQPSRGDTRP